MKAETKFKLSYYATFTVAVVGVVFWLLCYPFLAVAGLVFALHHFVPSIPAYGLSLFVGACLFGWYGLFSYLDRHLKSLGR